MSCLVITADVYIDLTCLYPLRLTFPVDTEVVLDSNNQCFHPVDFSGSLTCKFIIRRLAQIQHIDSFHSVQYFLRYLYATETGMQRHRHTPSSCTDYSVAYRENRGHRFVELRLLNHIALVSSTHLLSTSYGPVILYFFPVP